MIFETWIYKSNKIIYFLVILLIKLISSLSFFNKSLTISIFFFKTAKNNIFLLNYKIISFNYLILNYVRINMIWNYI